MVVIKVQYRFLEIVYAIIVLKLEKKKPKYISPVRITSPMYFDGRNRDIFLHISRTYLPC